MIKIKQSGLFILTTAMAILPVLLVPLLYTLTVSTKQIQNLNNSLNQVQAFYAGEACLQYGLAWVQQTHGVSVNSQAPYLADKTMTNSQGQGIHCNLVYSRPYPNTNPDVIQIKSTGHNVNNTSTDTISAQVIIKKADNGIASYLKTPIVGQGKVKVDNRGSIINETGEYSIRSGGKVEIKNKAFTQSSLGTSNKEGIGKDIIQNDETLANMTGDELFSSMFGKTKTEVMQSADVVLNAKTDIGKGPNGDGSVTNLDGIYKGSIIWVNGPAKIGKNGQVGTPDNPVFLIVNGNFNIGKNTKFYGVVYVANTVKRDGKERISIVKYNTNADVGLEDNADEEDEPEDEEDEPEDEEDPSDIASGLTISEGEVQVKGRVFYNQLPVERYGVPGAVDSVKILPSTWKDF